MTPVNRGSGLQSYWIRVLCCAVIQMTPLDRDSEYLSCCIWLLVGLHTPVVYCSYCSIHLFCVHRPSLPFLARCLLYCRFVKRRLYFPIRRRFLGFVPVNLLSSVISLSYTFTCVRSDVLDPRYPIPKVLTEVFLWGDYFLIGPRVLFPALRPILERSLIKL
jgi:hypothetical protein